jgi:uncharacterized protein (TIGR02466 family)
MRNNEFITLSRADLFLRNVGTEQQRSQLIDEIRSVKSQQPNGIEKSNVDCWRWNNPCSDIDWLMNHIIDMLDTAIALYDELDKTFASRKRLDLVTVDYWANVNPPGSRNNIHAHKPAQFSACYYLQAEGTGGIRFVNPSNTMAECNPGAPFTRDYMFLPKDGDLLVWPSWIPHEVETNFSDKERINLAFDLKIKE